MTRSVFFGTPAIAVPSLKALAEVSEVVGVVCQPDRPAGRGMKLTAPAVKVAAQELGLPVHQPVRVKTGNLDEWLKELGAEIAVVLAYGRILPPAVLNAPRFGCVNLHASLLPAYRGAAPINWALMNGETETGISLMQMDEGLDTGPVFSQHPLSISPDENAGQLTERLGELAANVVRSEFGRLVSGEALATAQDPSRATHAPPISKADLALDWSWPAEKLAAKIRGLAPIPCAKTSISGKTLKIQAARPCLSPCPAGSKPGEVVIADKTGLVISCGNGFLELLHAQLEGRKAMAAELLVQGRAIKLGDQLGADH